MAARRDQLFRATVIGRRLALALGAAGADARDRGRRLVFANDALNHGRRPQAGLHPHRPRQGRAGLAGGLEARLEKRRAADHRDDRDRHWRLHVGGRHRRVGLRLARHRPGPYQAAFHEIHECLVGYHSSTRGGVVTCEVPVAGMMRDGFVEAFGCLIYNL